MSRTSKPDFFIKISFPSVIGASTGEGLLINEAVLDSCSKRELGWNDGILCLG